MAYLELTEDEMVEMLADIQRKARATIEAGRANPYVRAAHEVTCNALMEMLKRLALSGDVV